MVLLHDTVLDHLVRFLSAFGFLVNFIDGTPPWHHFRSPSQNFLSLWCPWSILLMQFLNDIGLDHLAQNSVFCVLGQCYWWIPPPHRFRPSAQISFVLPLPFLPVTFPVVSMFPKALVPIIWTRNTTWLASALNYSDDDNYDNTNNSI